MVNKIKHMEPKERLFATVQGEPTDRTPIILNLSHYGANLVDVPLERYYRDPELYSSAQKLVNDQFKSDMIFTPFTLPIFGIPFGSSVKYFDDQPPNIDKYAPIEPFEFDKIRINEIEQHEIFTYLENCLELIIEKTEDKVPVGVICLSPLEWPIMIFGLEKWLETVLFDESTAIYIINKLGRVFSKFCNKMLKKGASAIILPISFVNLKIITRKVAEELATPLLIKFFKKIEGPIVLHHTGIEIAGSINYLKDLPNVIGVCVGKGDSLDEVREKLGDNQILLGNLDGPSMKYYSKDQIAERVKKILKDREDDKRFILTSSAADIDIDTPMENLSTIYETVSNFNNGGFNE